MLFTKKNEPVVSSAAPAAAKAPVAPAHVEVREQKADRSPTNHNVSTLNQNLCFEGVLKCSGRVTIDCDFKGSINTADILAVGPSAVVTAEIAAGVVEVSGKVHGNIKAKTRVKIVSGGEVHGNIETPNLSMEDGVVFEGSCTRPVAAPAPTVTQPAPAPAVKAPPRPVAAASPAPVAAPAKSEVLAKCEVTV